MSDRMWFLVVPDKAPNADGTWKEVRVNIYRAADKAKYSRPWEYYDTLCGPGHVAVAVSRVPPGKGD